MGTIKNPICPYCHTKMASVMFEWNEGTGYNLMWTCSCEKVKEIETIYNKKDGKNNPPESVG